MISRYFPAWYLGRFPERRVILASYGASLADSWSGKARDLLAAHGRGVFGVRLGTQARNSWTTTRGGELNSAGVGGATTGKGADLIVIDDPVKNAEEALSKRYKERARDWYQTVAQTRLEPNGAVIILQTRWSQDDLAGVVAEDFAREGWHRLTLPAVATAGDSLGRAPGEALFPERFSAEMLEQKRLGMLPLWWSALYQQTPISVEGSLFAGLELEVFDFEDEGYRVDGSHLSRGAAEVAIIADLNITGKEDGDPFVAAACAFVDHPTLGRVLLVLDLRREWVDTTQHAAILRSMREQWGADWIGVEAVAYQAELVQRLQAEGLPVRALTTAGKDKRVRAIPAATKLRERRIRVARGAPWVADLREELHAFPRGAHDDQVDVLAYAARELPSSALMLNSTSEDPPDVDDDARYMV